MNSLPSTNYVPMDDVGSDESDLKTPRLGVRFWKFTTFLLGLGLLVALVAIVFTTGVLKIFNQSSSEIAEEVSTDQISRIDREPAFPDTSGLLTNYVWPDGKYQLYSERNPENYDLKIFAQSREFRSRVVELTEFKAFTGEIDGVIGSRATDNNSRFIIRVRFGQNFRYYLLGVVVNGDVDKIESQPPIELNFESELFSPDEYHIQYDVLSWIDNERIIVAQTVTKVSNPLDVTTFYWMAPVLNLGQKSYFSF